MQAKGYTGYFKTIITLTAVFILCVFLFSTYLSYRTSISAAESLHLLFLHEQDEKIETHLHRYDDDIMFLTGVPPIQGMIRAREEGGYDSKEQTSYGFWVKRLQQIFESLGIRKTEYLKLRYMDEKGNEIVRVDFKDGKARIIPDTELQNKADRYYFIETMKLSAGQVYFSNIDLNQEGGNIPVLYQSTLRIATPIFNKNGRPRGIIIASVTVQSLLHSSGLLKSQKSKEVYIVDQDGFYLHHDSDPDREWGSAYDLNTGKNLKAYQPDLFGKIMNNDTGMAFSFDSYRFVIFSRVEFPHIKEKYLVIVSEVSPTIILAPMFRTIIIILSFIFFFSVVLYAFVRRATQALREKEAALTGSEERFRKTVMVAAFPMMIQAEDGEVVQINKAWEEITGYAHADIPTISDWMTKAYGQSRAVTKAYIDTIFSLDTRKDQGEYIITAKDGSKHIWDIASSPLGKLSDGRRLVVSTARDVTEKKQFEEQIKTILQASMDAFYTSDTQGHFFDPNDAYCRLIGYTRDELLKMTIRDVEAIETNEDTARHIRKIIESGYDRFETRHRCKDGRLLDVEISCNFSPVDGGRIFVFLKDITERKANEAMLLQSREELNLRVEERTSELAEANKLLYALNSSQSMFISEIEPKILFDGILQSILVLTGSQYGFIGEVFFDGKGAPYLKTNAISNVAWNEETRKHYEKYASGGMEFRNLKTLLGQILTSGQQVISNDPAHDPRRGGLPEGHPSLDAFLGMPLYRGQKLVGAIGIANRSGGYDENLVNYLQPFFVSCAGIIEAYRSDQERKQALEEINRNYMVQSTVSAILQTSLKNVPLEEILLTTLKKILAIPWLSFEKKGAIFLIEDDPDILVLKAHNNFSDQAQESCGRIPVGKCHCGQAMLTKKIEFSDCVDEGHEIRYEGMIPHGDYCIPILFQEQAIGVLNVHVKHGHQRDQRGDEFLSMVANALATIISRKQAEDALSKSEASLREAQRISNIGSWNLDLQKNRLTWSDESYRIFEIEPSEFGLSYEAFLAAIHPDDREMVNSTYTESVKNRKPYAIDHRLLMKDGRIKYVQERCETIYDDQGNPVRSFGTTQDITIRKKVEDALRDSELRHRMFYESGMIGVIYWNMNGQIVDANDKFLEMVGYTRDELAAGRVDWVSMTPPEFRHLDDSAVEELKATGVNKMPFEKQYIRKDGSRIPIILAAATLDEERFNGVAFVLDITERKRAEEALKGYSKDLESKVAIRTIALEAARLEAETANRAKSDFLASMSHELRTPMNAIIGFSQVLQARYYGDLNDKQFNYINDILDSGNHLMSLINDILDLSKIEAGKTQLELSRVDITALLKNSLLMIREKALRHGITVELNIPASIEGMEMNGDERKLKQIMFNFLSNAAKFTSEGGRITVQARRVNSEQYLVNSKKLFTDDYSLTTDTDFIEISVADTGIGIRAEDRERIFEPFVQIKGGTTDKTPGTGLGLSLTKEYVEMHGGCVWVESEGEGKGSRFMFIIPIAEEGGQNG